MVMLEFTMSISLSLSDTYPSTAITERGPSASKLLLTHLNIILVLTWFCYILCLP